MENSGWISLHRRILENAISSRPAWFSVWVHLLLMANHNDNDFIWNDRKITVKRGQLLTGRDELAKKCGVSPSLVERVLKYLEIEHQIGQQKTTKYRLITILNWEKYQNSDNKADSKRTTKRQQADTNNNDNNDNKEDRPKDKAVFFFKGITDFITKVSSEESKKMGEFLQSVSSEYGIDSIVRKKAFWDEIVAFGDYWQEKDPAGKYERWQLQKTFEVDKRLRTWFRNKKEWSKSKGPVINKGRDIIL
jgi:hypothetical protein